MEETQGRGADVVIVACNSAQAQAGALELARKRGNVNFFGGLPKDSPTAELNTSLIHYSEIFVTGTHVGSSEHCRKALSLIGDRKIEAALVAGTEFARQHGIKNLPLCVAFTSTYEMIQHTVCYTASGDPLLGFRMIMDDLASVMCDCSTLPFDENIRRTAEYVEGTRNQVRVEGAVDEIYEVGESEERNELTTPDKAE